jgi:FKBP-type peptidyl-prolyl cis-trans isomerase
MYRTIACIPLLCLWLGTVTAAEPELTTDDQIFSYGIGLQMGQSLQAQGIDIDIEAFSQAVQDVLNGNPPRVTAERMQAVFETKQREAERDFSARAEANAQAAESFLAENRKQEGVVETESGLQYQIVESGDGKTPALSDSVTVHYRGTLLDGTEFDSSYARGEPATFQVSGVIKG